MFHSCFIRGSFCGGLLVLFHALGRNAQGGAGQALLARPSAALAEARDGDHVDVDTAGNYGGDVATIRTSNLVIRGVGPGRKLAARAITPAARPSGSSRATT